MRTMSLSVTRPFQLNEEDMHVKAIIGWRRRIAAAAACMLGLFGAALAAPPIDHGDSPRSTAARSSASHRALDLSAPTPPSAKRIPLTSRTPIQSGQYGDADEDGQRLTLDADAWKARTSPRFEELARRVHREGLPVARLWENQSSLVSLGLNQRGKPGLWIVHKVH